MPVLASPRPRRLGDAESLADYRWVPVNVSASRVASVFNNMGDRLRSKPYSAAGTGNSNRFIYQVITRAGGQMPSAVVPWLTVASGICGGGAVVGPGRSIHYGWIWMCSRPALITSNITARSGSTAVGSALLPPLLANKVPVPRVGAHRQAHEGRVE